MAPAGGSACEIESRERMKLPKLYTLKQVREAAQVGRSSVMTSIQGNPYIRPIGRDTAHRSGVSVAR